MSASSISITQQKNLIRLTDAFLTRAQDLARSGLTSGDNDIVSIMVNINKAKETFDLLVQEVSSKRSIESIPNISLEL